MKRTITVARRALRQLMHDKRLFALSIFAPLIIVFFLKIFLDTLPPMVSRARYIMPVAAFVVHFLTFLLCSIVLVQERTLGTLERMFITGFNRVNIIGGYVIGYMLLGTLQAAAALTEAILLFNLSYSFETIALLFLIIWLLAIASVMLGIFISTFARNEAQVFPFIPLLIFPSIFLSGLLVSVDQLPLWANTLGYAFPLRYANNAIQELLLANPSMHVVWLNGAVLAGYAILLLALASGTLKEVE